MEKNERTGPDKMSALMAALVGMRVQSTTTNLHQDRNAWRILVGMGCGILSADSTDQSGLGMECTLDIFHKSIRIAEKNELKCLSGAEGGLSSFSN
jgi:hypothetical protein